MKKQNFIVSLNVLRFLHVFFVSVLFLVGIVFLFNLRIKKDILVIFLLMSGLILVVYYAQYCVKRRIVYFYENDPEHPLAMKFILLNHIYTGLYMIFLAYMLMFSTLFYKLHALICIFRGVTMMIYAYYINSHFPLHMIHRNEN